MGLKQARVIKVFVDSSVLIAAAISPSKSLIAKVSKTVEEKDAPIVAGAIAAKADYLVSYDRKHLLHQKQKISDNFKVKTVTPDELIK